ncbi:unnamed protein product [Nippostrongylus brasiliensis]|uniref:NAD(P)-binding protein n=1 Tax=Nippostrongylus brasiliensis TaxID=27835 RepID=A0A0N4YEF5_NIPBR|nr:unnamed protein product [Nippostrongylus brasiliensis]
MKEVAHFADEVKSRFPDLNVLLCNAGVLNPRRAETKDGLEMTFQGMFSNAGGFPAAQHNSNIQIRHVVLCCGAMSLSVTALDWSDVMAKKEYEKYLVYSRSKLCLHLMAFALHRRMNIARRNVAVNVVELGKEREPNNNGKISGAEATDERLQERLWTYSTELAQGYV